SRFESAAQCAPGVASMSIEQQPRSGPLRPSVSAEALKAQLRSAISGRSAEEALAVLEGCEVESMTLRWMLLSRLGDDEWGGEAVPNIGCSSVWFSFEVPCLGGFVRAVGPDAQASKALPDLGTVLERQDVLQALLSGGGCKNWSKAVEVLCRILDNGGPPPHGFQLQLAVATAFCVAEGETDRSFHEDPIDLIERYRCFSKWASDGQLFPSFRT
ncbi:unnamed protein product, partial [Polarella glacialis]